MSRLFGLWGHQPTFRDFIIASERVGRNDALVLKDGQLGKLFPNETKEAQLNRRTWQAFRRAVEREFPKAKRAEVCERYGFDWNAFVQSDRPLKRTFVEYFGTGAANLTFSDLRRVLGREGVEDLSPKFLHQLVQEVTEARYIGPWSDPSEVHGGARETHENFTSVRLNTDQQRANLFRGIEGLVSKDPNIPRLHPYYSRLAMGIISHLETQKDAKDVHLIIPAPGTREGRVEYYRIHDIISKEGLCAVALVPLGKGSLEPLLVFRCTRQNPGQTDFIPSILNNMEEHIGQSGYEASRKALKKLINDETFTRGGKIKVLAYSQGGGYAGYFLSDFWSKVDEFVGFNTVGSDARVVESLADDLNFLPKHAIPPSIYLYRNKGDWVNASGEKHIGWGVEHPNAITQIIEWEIDGLPHPTDDVWDLEQVQRWLKLHGTRPMDCEKEGIDKGKYEAFWRYPYKLFQGPTNFNLNADSSSSALEQKRRDDTKVLYYFLSTMRDIIDFCIRAFGLDFLKKNW